MNKVSRTKFMRAEGKETGTGEVSNRYTSKTPSRQKEYLKEKGSKNKVLKDHPYTLQKKKGRIPKEFKNLRPKGRKSLIKTFSQPKLVEKERRTQDNGEEARIVHRTGQIKAICP